MASEAGVLESLNYLEKAFLDYLTLFFAKNLIHAFLILKPVLIKALGGIATIACKATLLNLFSKMAFRI